jgi:hypothetical protein
MEINTLLNKIIVFIIFFRLFFIGAHMLNAGRILFWSTLQSGRGRGSNMTPDAAAAMTAGDAFCQPFSLT